MQFKVEFENQKLEAKSISSGHLTTVIDRFFQALPSGQVLIEAVPVSAAVAIEPAEVKEVSTKAANEVVAKVSETLKPCTIKPLPIKKPIAQEPQVSKQVVLTGGNATMTQRPFEGLDALLERPPQKIGDHTVKWVGEGIKENEKGEKLYRTHYWCPCGYSGRRYLPTYNEYSNCHNCGTKLALETAVPGEELKQDKDGAFFIARSEFEPDSES